jgi:hypothetical protein
MKRGRAGLKASQVIIYCPHNNQLMVCPDTLSTQNTFGEIPYNERICLFQWFVVGHRVKVCLPYTELGGYLTQLTAVPFAAKDTGFRMFGDHQPNYIPPVLIYTG